MNNIVHNRLIIIDAIRESLAFDYDALQQLSLDKTLFSDKEKARIVNSFLFNLTKLQDNMGAKFFKELLLELREIDSVAVPMLDVIAKLEQLEIVEDLSEWDLLREIRNELTHNYSIDYDERLQNLKRAFWAYEELEKIYTQICSKIL